MQIKKDTVIGFHYTMSERLESESEEAAYVELESSLGGEPILSLMGKGGMVPGLEVALYDKEDGEKFTVEIAPEDAYGLHVPKEPQRVPIKHLQGKSKKLKKGQVVHINTEHGTKEATVVKVGKFNVDVDTNHPLAGKHLRFDLEIVSVREASKEELAHGHAHGAGGHQH